jgi:hypothetical protein
MARLSLDKSVALKLNSIVKSLKGSVEVGFHDTANYPDGTPVATVAYFNEFGHGGHFPAPPRPFFRTMIKEKSPQWPDQLAGIIAEQQALVDAKGDGSKLNYYRIWSRMGSIIEDELKDSITNFVAPELSLTTLALRAKFGNQPQNITIEDVLAAQRAVASGKAPLASGTEAHPLIWTGYMLRNTSYRVIGVTDTSGSGQ